MIKIDEIDKKIMIELFNKDRISNSKIAKKLSVSKETINYRLKKLYSENILLNTIVVIDFSVLDYSVFRLQIKLKNISIEKREILIGELKNLNYISWIIKVQGSWDLVLLFYIKNISDFNNVYDDFVNKYHDIIEDKLFTIVKSISHFSPNYLSDYSRNYITTGILNKKIELEDIEKKILKSLYNNGNKSLVEISIELGVAVNTVKYNLNKLKNNNVISLFKANINFKKLDYEHFKVVLILNDLKDKLKLKKYLMHRNEVIYITESLGKYDLEFELITKNTNDLMNLISEIKTIVNIKTFEIIYSNEEIMVNALPF